MSESENWIKVIEWLNKNDMIYAFHNVHKSELMKDHEKWVIEFEKKSEKIIPVHSIKIKNTYSDFLAMESHKFEDLNYLYSFEVKGKINREGFIKGRHQAEDAQNGTDYSVLLIPEDYVKPDYKSELSKNGIILGEIDKKGNIFLLNKQTAKTYFNPKTHNRILKFLLIIKQKREGELISKIRSNKTIFIHYLIPGFLKYLYIKYENKKLKNSELEIRLKTHWRKVKPFNRKNWDKLFSKEVECPKFQFESWSNKNIKDFIKVSNQFGFTNINRFLFSFIEFYLASLALPRVDIFPEVQNKQIKKNIIRLFSCAVDMNGTNIWLFQKHPLLSDFILDFLSKRTDMKIFNQWVRSVIEKVHPSIKKDMIPFNKEGYDKIRVNFRDIVNLTLKADFYIAKEFFLKGRVGKRVSKNNNDICISPIGNLKCPKSANEKCYGQIIKDFKELLKYNQEISSLLSDPNNHIDTYMDLPKKYFEKNDKTSPLRFGFIKAIVDSHIFYNFKRNLIHLGYFPKEFVENNGFLKENKYPLGNDTVLGKYCPYLDLWSINIESGIFSQLF